MNTDHRTGEAPPGVVDDLIPETPGSTEANINHLPEEAVIVPAESEADIEAAKAAEQVAKSIRTIGEVAKEPVDIALTGESNRTLDPEVVRIIDRGIDNETELATLEEYLSPEESN